MLMARIHPKIAQERLVRSTTSTTMDLYSHVSENMQQGAADVIDASFRSAIKAD
jgi:hypothetical protein